MRKRVVAAIAVLALSAACTGGGEPSLSPSAGPPEPRRGGTLRIADWLGLGALDPAKIWASFRAASQD